MDHIKPSTISFLIKAAIGVVFAVLFIVLLSQYISMAQLENKKNDLNTELENTTQQYEELKNRYNDINENYEEYVEDYTRENNDYGYDGDELINK